MRSIAHVCGKREFGKRHDSKFVYKKNENNEDKQ